MKIFQIFTTFKDKYLVFILDMLYLTHNKCIYYGFREFHIRSWPFKRKVKADNQLLTTNLSCIANMTEKMEYLCGQTCYSSLEGVILKH